MDSFSISQLSRFSGIKSHTIRAWERRYQALTPSRSEGNTRFYSGEQLRRLLNLVSLLPENGKPAELCVLSNEELAERVEMKLKRTKGAGMDYYMTQLIAAGLDFNEERFNRILQYSMEQLGVSSTYTNLIYPSLRRLGLMWSAQLLSPAHEHFISNLVVRKLNALIDALPLPKDEKDTWILFLPEDEFHELGLLMSHFLLRHAGHKVIYLGSNLPFSVLAPTVAQIEATHALFFLVRRDEKEEQEAYLREVSSIKGLKRILVAVSEDVQPDMSFDARFAIINAPEDLDREIGRIED